MQRALLAGGALEVSRICLGTMTFGGQTNAEDAARMVDMAMDRGINFFDTANGYTGGESERITGRILGARRSSVVLASKVGMKTDDQPAGLSRSAIMTAIDKSLSRLNTDYLDIYYLHTPDHSTPLEETLEAMHRLVQAGKVRCVASSNHASWQVVRMLQIADANSYAPALITQPMYNLLARLIEDEYLPMCKACGVSTIVYNPLAGGLLTGKHTNAAPLPGTRFDGNQMYLARYWNDVNHAAVSRLNEIAGSAGRSMVSVALNWLLHHSEATGIILGASKLDHLRENLDACGDGELPAEILHGCDEVWGLLRGAAPKYNR
jgi:aryl-alcohol dehydrogenase (NADP+)